VHQAPTVVSSLLLVFALFSIRDCMGYFSLETTDKISNNWISQDGNSVAENLMVAVGRTLEECCTQLSASSVDSLLFLHSAFDDKF